MKKTVSDLMLERYRLGELDGEDQKTVEAILEADADLGVRLKKLIESDEELHHKYPRLDLQDRKRRRRFSVFTGKFSMLKIAAAVVLVIMFPLVYFLNNSAALENKMNDQVPGNYSDRAKGVSQGSSSLSVYLKGDSDNPLTDKTLLTEGSTVQLAYTASAGDECYGVIFSIDGRSEVTMHYPYRMGQSSLLVSGKRTLLDEAYTLDDAPGYEVFVMVVSTEMLEAASILRQAKGIAVKAAGSVVPEAAIEKECTDLFKGCDIKIATVLKN